MQSVTDYAGSSRSTGRDKPSMLSSTQRSRLLKDAGSQLLEGQISKGDYDSITGGVLPGGSSAEHHHSHFTERSHLDTGERLESREKRVWNKMDHIKQEQLPLFCAETGAPINMAARLQFKARLERELQKVEKKLEANTARMSTKTGRSQTSSREPTARGKSQFELADRAHCSDTIDWNCITRSSMGLKSDIHTSRKHLDRWLKENRPGGVKALSRFA